MKKRINVITTLLCLSPIILGVIFYSKLPDSMATHFNMRNEPNGYMPKNIALFGLPVVMAVIQFVVCFMMDQDYRKKNVPKKMENLCKFLVPICCMMAQSVTVMYGLNESVNVSSVVIVGLGMIFLCIGNLLPKCKYNYVVGIKIPTTFGSEENWNKTHRVAGFVWVIGSLGMIIAGIVKCYIVASVIVVVIIIIPVMYSLLLTNREKNSKK